MTWREHFAPIIAELLNQCKGKSLAEKQKFLRGTCPEQYRRYFPYKAWLDECKHQLGLKPDWRDKQVPSAKGQKKLFGDG